MRVSSIGRSPRETSRVAMSMVRSAKVSTSLVAVGVRHDPAQQRAQPGQQLLQGERLGEVVVGAGVETLDPVADGVAGGEHQDRHVVAGRAQRPGRLDAVEPRHHHVHHDDVGVLAPTRDQGLGAVGGQRDLVAVELQRPAQRVAHGLVVVDDEHAGLGVGHARKDATEPERG